MKTVRFWGVRGSIPSPGRHTVRYGGNTPCVSVELDAGHTLVLDAGTGLYRLGLAAPDGEHTYFLLLSHVHWDHIQGWPMFHPHMRKSVSIRVLCEMEPAIGRAFLDQIDGKHFPLESSELKADVRLETDGTNRLLEPFGVEVNWIRLNHRGVCFGFRISSDSGTLLYITDHEMDAVENRQVDFEELVEFSRCADILIHDAPFTADEMVEKSGWGHSSVERACDLAAAAACKKLILFHHEPSRGDDELDGLIALAKNRLRDLGASCSCDAAREGASLSF